MLQPAGSVTIEPHAGQTLVRLCGEIDASVRGEASRVLVEVLTLAAPVVLDLGAVTFIDSTGLAFLVKCHQVCAEARQPCSMRDVPEFTRFLLAVLGAQELVTG